MKSSILDPLTRGSTLSLQNLPRQIAGSMHHPLRLMMVCQPAPFFQMWKKVIFS